MLRQTKYNFLIMSIMTRTRSFMKNLCLLNVFTILRERNLSFTVGTEKSESNKNYFSYLCNVVSLHIFTKKYFI